MTSMDELKIPQIEGKVLAVLFGSGDRDYAYIEEPSLEMQAGRLFLTGTYFYSNPSGRPPERVCIAWDSIKEYFIFESDDHCRQYMTQRRGKRKKKSWWRK